MNTLFRKIIDEVQWHLPKKMAHSIIHFRANKCFMPWNNPQTYDEKVRWLLVNCYGKKESKYADKYEVRSYVEECGLSHILIHCYGVWDRVENIEINRLPQKFIMKATQGSGPDCYAIVRNKKDKAELNEALQKMKKALKFNTAKFSCQYHYKYIKPRIICEELLEDEHGKSHMTDYKIVCTNGIARYILVCSDRSEGRDYFDREWNYLPFTKPEYRSKYKIPKPEGLQKMLNIAEKLSAPFAVARIDLYNVNGKIYFGEITLTPSACYTGNLTKEAQLEIGSKIQLPKVGK